MGGTLVIKDLQLRNHKYVMHMDLSFKKELLCPDQQTCQVLSSRH